MKNTSRRSLIGAALRLTRQRPIQLASAVRSYSLFWLTGLFRGWFFPDGSGVRFGRNVRLQRIRCLSAERPGASIEIGDHSIVFENAQIEAFGSGKIRIGEASVLGDNRIYSRYEIRIGKRAVTSWNVLIQDFDPHPTDPELRSWQIRRLVSRFLPSSSDAPFDPGEIPASRWSFPGEAISIGDDVWIGANATILKGARIGDGSIVATGAVVLAGDYPARSLIAGNPAKAVSSLGG